jgi:hypothetical protein
MINSLNSDLEWIKLLPDDEQGFFKIFLKRMDGVILSFRIKDTVFSDWINDEVLRLPKSFLEYFDRKGEEQ